MVAGVGYGQDQASDARSSQPAACQLLTMFSHLPFWHLPSLPGEELKLPLSFLCCERSCCCPLLYKLSWVPLTLASKRHSLDTPLSSHFSLQRRGEEFTYSQTQNTTLTFLSSHWLKYESNWLEELSKTGWTNASGPTSLSLCVKSFVVFCWLVVCGVFFFILKHLGNKMVSG